MSRFLSFLLLAACSGAVAKEIKQSPETEAKFVGAIGCRSSSCHGGAGEKRSQYITWSQKDFHTRAYAILLDARSARIGEAVGISQPQSNARCTVCHSPFQSVAQSRLTPTAHPDEGVSCESCHGAAESWLRGHTRGDWTYATRVSAGMHDLRNLYVRANACVACHQNVDADILKAGHPELVFELDSQSVNEPKHWPDEDQWIGPRAWFIGQAVALREASWALTTSLAAPDEVSNLRADQAALGWLVLTTTGAIKSLPQFTSGVMKFAPTTQNAADELAHAAVTMAWSESSVRNLAAVLASTDKEFVGEHPPVFDVHNTRGELAARAKRLVLALDRLMTALNQNLATPLTIEKELDALREDVRLRDNFDAKRFAEHLRAFHAKL